MKEKSKKQELLIRAYREGDEEGLYKLWHVIHPLEYRNQDQWLRWWKWIYKENPAGKGLIWLAEDNDQIVAQHMMTPVRLKIKDQIINGCLGMEAMTHTNYRRRGLFTIITKGVLGEAASIGINIQIGMPNRLSGAGWSKIDGWFKVSNVKVMVKIMNWENVIRLKIKNKPLSRWLAICTALIFDKVFFRNHKVPKIDGLNITEVTSFDERFDRLWNRISDQAPIMVVRNAAFLNWRYKTPKNEYSVYVAEKYDEVLGYLVTSNGVVKGARVCYFTDMMAEYEGVMHCLISKAVEICQISGIDYISYALIADKTYHRTIRKHGFLLYPLIRDRYLGIYSNSTQVSRSYLQNPKNWLFQHGDTDII